MTFKDIKDSSTTKKSRHLFDFSSEKPKSSKRSKSSKKRKSSASSKNRPEYLPYKYGVDEKLSTSHLPNYQPKEVRDKYGEPEFHSQIQIPKRMEEPEFYSQVQVPKRMEEPEFHSQVQITKRMEQPPLIPQKHVSQSYFADRQLEFDLKHNYEQKLNLLKSEFEIEQNASQSKIATLEAEIRRLQRKEDDLSRENQRFSESEQSLQKGKF